jgi:hypothetical protein
MNDKSNDPVPTFDGEPGRLDKSRLPSRHTTVGPERAPHRSFLYAMGLSSQEIAQPFVGVVTTWNEAAPCNITLSRQAQAAKRGVTAAGGTPREFTTITVTDGIAMGHAGMKASLVSREVIADSVELSVRGHCYDALVGLAGCDKTLPGLMMAMLRLNVPSVFLYGGSILPGRFRGKDVTVLDVFEGTCAEARSVACNDDFCANSSQVTFAAAAGQSYKIRVGGFGANTGSGVMSITNTQTCPGDADGISPVGLGDIAVIINHWAQSASGCNQGDLSGNGAVGLEDIAIVINSWSTACP